MIGETVEVFDIKLDRWVAGEVETDGDFYATVKSAETVDEKGNPVIYVIPQSGLHMVRPKK